MKAFVLLSIALSLSVLVGAGKGMAAELQADEQNIRRSYTDLKRALIARNGAAAVAQVSNATLADYELARKIAIEPSRYDLEALPQRTVLLALRFRRLLNPPGLESISHRAFEWAVDHSLVTQPSLAPIELGVLRVVGNQATATLVLNNQPSDGPVMHFELNQGTWKVEWGEFENILEPTFAEMRAKTGMSKYDVARSIVELRHSTTALSAPPSSTTQRLAQEIHPRCPIPGTSCSIVPCDTMRPAENLTGLVGLRRSISVFGVELPAPAQGNPLVELAGAFSAQALQRQGLTLDKSEPITVDGVECLLCTASQPVQGNSYRKYLLLMPTRTKLLQIVISLPMSDDERMHGAVRAMIHSVRREEAVAAGNTPYVLSLPSEWKLARQVGPLDLYSRRGEFPIPRGAGAFAVLNLNVSVDADERERFVHSKNTMRNGFSNLSVQQTRNVVVDGIPANLSYVSALDQQSGESIVLQYCYLFLPHTTFLLEWRRGPEMSDRRFEEISLSWRLK